MAAAIKGSGRASAFRKSKGPSLNLFDVPEIMPGAKCSANPAQREEFEDRCRKLYDEGLDDGAMYTRTVSSSAGASAEITLQAMFPAFDEGVINMIVADAASIDHAIEALLFMSSGKAQGSETPTLSHNVGVNDHEQFPCISDRFGWQVMPSTRALDRDADASPENAWRDLAHATKDYPAPPASCPFRLVGPRKARQRQSREEEMITDQPLVTDYEARHQAGEKRVQLRVMYARKPGSQKRMSPVCTHEHPHGYYLDDSE